MRLRRADCSGPGLRRLRRGRGFAYLDPDGRRVGDRATLERIRELAIPPAWTDVWICPDPRGHLQATGCDAAGRKQYLYHPRWRERRDREKFERMTAFARVLPRLRRRVSADLRGDDEPTRQRVLACAVRLLDIGLFRIGGEEYDGVGLATLQKRNVRLTAEGIEFDYVAKAGIHQVQVIDDRRCAAVLARLRRRRGGGDDLLAHRSSRRWTSVRSGDVNDYLKRHAGERFSAKDFRTWHATVLAAGVLADRGGRGRRAINAAADEVAGALGNTPGIARGSYIDPRVFDRFLAGQTVPAGSRGRRLERAVLELLD